MALSGWKSKKQPNNIISIKSGNITAFFRDTPFVFDKIKKSNLN